MVVVDSVVFRSFLFLLGTKKVEDRGPLSGLETRDDVHRAECDASEDNINSSLLAHPIAVFSSAATESLVIWVVVGGNCQGWPRSRLAVILFHTLTSFALPVI